jgi:OmcA/MtrC family decaheme c-type cytochrome
VLIHRIHHGESPAGSFQVYGFNSSVHDYGAVEFPGDISNCQSCHLPGTYGLPSGLQPTQISQDGEVVSTLPPITAICTACHDSAAGKGHTELQTTASGVETCAVCHESGREFDVAAAHP